MRWPRLIAGIAGLGVLLAGPASAAAKPPGSPAPLRDTVTATGDLLPLDPFTDLTDIELDAHSGPSGENPGGHVSFVVSNPASPRPQPPLLISGSVNCLDVSGNTAAMTIAGPFPDVPGITAFAIRVVDNGGGGLDSFEYNVDDPEVPGAIDCHDFSQYYFGGPLVGRAIVTDVDPPARPTSKKQCKRGGYKRFGFKNQGRCIKYVQHHRHGGSVDSHSEGRSLRR